MVTPELAQAVLAEIDESLPNLNGRDAALHAAMTIVARQLPAYKWAGVYILDGGVLNLGPYVGAKTEHTLIPIGRGVCGTAIAEERDIVVADVRALDNYLSCSLDTRSEIVALIRAPEDGRILGQIDADGHTVAAFDETDLALLREIAVRLGPRLLRSPE
jgi:L-methionine (R)-S-oxide reductase